jgi:hypothetical protein
MTVHGVWLEESTTTEDEMTAKEARAAHHAADAKYHALGAAHEANRKALPLGHPDRKASFEAVEAAKAERAAAWTAYLAAEAAEAATKPPAAAKVWEMPDPDGRRRALRERDEALRSEQDRARAERES